MANWKHKLLLNLWAIATLGATISLTVYLVGSTTLTKLHAMKMQTSEMHFQEQPWKLSIAFGLMVLISVAITVAVKHMPPFQGSLRKVMITGSVTSILGFALYGLYVGPLSTMQRAQDVPEVGEQAPDFAITDPDGRTWRLSDFHSDILLVFYRGYW